MKTWISASVSKRVETVSSSSFGGSSLELGCLRAGWPAGARRLGAPASSVAGWRRGVTEREHHDSPGSMIATSVAQLAQLLFASRRAPSNAGDNHHREETGAEVGDVVERAGSVNEVVEEASGQRPDARLKADIVPGQ